MLLEVWRFFDFIQDSGVLFCFVFLAHLVRCFPSVLHSPDFEVLYNEVFLCGERGVVEGGTGKT